MTKYLIAYTLPADKVFPPGTLFYEVVSGDGYRDALATFQENYVAEDYDEGEPYGFPLIRGYRDLREIKEPGGCLLRRTFSDGLPIPGPSFLTAEETRDAPDEGREEPPLISNPDTVHFYSEGKKLGSALFNEVYRATALYPELPAAIALGDGHTAFSLISDYRRDRDDPDPKPSMRNPVKKGRRV